MKIFGLVAEFNPLHKGHKYIIDKIKSENKDAKIVVVLSSSFVQRGEPSILSKWERADLSLKAGADLVLELPVVFSCQNAEIFSKGALMILNAVKITDLVFGAENSDLDKILKIAKILNQDNKNLDALIKSNLKVGNSYIKSRDMALKSLNLLEEDEILYLEKPNNILGIEYTRAILDKGYNIKINPVSRVYSDHNSLDEFKEFTSSTNIREKIKNDVQFHYLLPDIYDGISFKNTPDENLLFNLIKYRFLINPIDYKKIMDYEEGLENRVVKYLNSPSLEEFYNRISNKRITKSRIRRFIISSLLDIDKKDIFEFLENEPYIRVLGVNTNGMEILRNLESPYINKFSDYKKLPESINKIAKIEEKSTDLHSLLTLREPHLDFITSPIIKK